ncbi:hypothetical protein I3215_30930 [Streptomyces sp. RB110-1]|uniref:helix-turn-helix transcriptional regulator n=1 Tax=unclassified Streptomyces TaxID=2593676 RepID=UPI0018FF37A2|nr:MULTISPECIES: LuxR C-terminal-related transcriptional regulator [unclassified Streptomyces]MBK0377230.1 hypothetical protein [Streptomyces sp. RB110-1]MBK0386398.1 hypothetical protein [Streptomyces sp. RB110-2]
MAEDNALGNQVHGLEELASPAEEMTAFREVIRSARSEILLAIPRDSSITWNAGERSLLRADGTRAPIRVRVVMDPAVEGLGAEREEGGEVRVSSHLHQTLLVADRRSVLISSGTAPVASAVVVHQPRLGSLLADGFDQLWDTAEEPRTVESFTRFQQQLVGLIASGVTDDAAARALGLSARTVRRHLNRLMASVGARSRLELGMRLGENVALRSASSPGGWRGCPDRFARG